MGLSHLRNHFVEAVVAAVSAARNAPMSLKCFTLSLFI